MAENGESSNSELSSEEKNWGVYCHLSAFLGFIIPLAGNFIGPILVWLYKKDEFPFVDDQGKEVLNFQITMLLMSIVCGLLTVVFIGFLFLWILPFYFLIVTVIGAVKASDGNKFRYPYTIRLIK